MTGAATITVSGISDIDKIMIVIDGAGCGTAASIFAVRVNTLSTSIYNRFGPELRFPGTYAATSYTSVGNTANKLDLVKNSSADNDKSNGYCLITGCATSGDKIFQSAAGGETNFASNPTTFILGGFIETSAVITSVSLLSSAGNFNSGTLFVYGSA